MRSSGKFESKPKSPLICNAVFLNTVPHIMTAVYADSMLLQYPFLFFCRFECSCMHLRRALIKRVFMRYDEIDPLFNCFQYRAFARYPAYSDSSYFLLIISKQKMHLLFFILRRTRVPSCSSSAVTSHIFIA